jgi:hypothetical protein
VKAANGDLAIRSRKETDGGYIELTKRESRQQQTISHAIGSHRSLHQDMEGVI